MLGHRLRRWPNNKPSLIDCAAFASVYQTLWQPMIAVGLALHFKHLSEYTVSPPLTHGILSDPLSPKKLMELLTLCLLIMTVVFLICFISRPNHSYWQ